MKLLTTLCCCAAVCVSGSAVAYESENAVPLTLGLVADQLILQQLKVRIEGRQITVSTGLHNDTGQSLPMAWYAYTPQFGLLGEGEEHADKSFADISSRLNDQMRPSTVYRRGYFMGRDITAELSKAGLPALPSQELSETRIARLPAVQGMRLNDWQGYISYSWNAQVPAGRSIVVEVSYRALPEFALVDVRSALFARTVQQHCGDVEQIRRRLAALTNGAAQVIVESYEVPVSYMLMRDTKLDIVQPEVNWQKAKPLISQVCGLANPALRASVAGIVEQANQALSVLVISALPGATLQEGAGRE